MALGWGVDSWFGWAKGEKGPSRYGCHGQTVLHTKRTGMRPMASPGCAYHCEIPLNRREITISSRKITRVYNPTRLFQPGARRRWPMDFGIFPWMASKHNVVHSDPDDFPWDGIGWALEKLRSRCSGSS
ncbi:predicted protein [Uncinocarpus reesii 1704]|uniref:Uncharacterized protein n=1 Tax=Uncinocarpus reesii (strain UAMH 1704) TaxID=336963 RepID=C4JSM0_UNCRE|nr:uncharacterized protein UREG_05459 [Uncinocarpus reesii 1704]EEP80617.1 predicted protein [Uncinocarpus reesii 1704]